MRKLTLLLTMLLTITTVLSSCSPAPSAYDFEEIGLEPPELAEGEKAVWVKSGAYESFMANVIYHNGIENFARGVSFELQKFYEEKELIDKYEPFILIFDSDKNVKTPTEKNVWNYFYDAIFSPNEFLYKHISEEVETEQILCFDCTYPNSESFSRFHTELAVYYKTNKGDYILLMCRKLMYTEGDEIYFLIPWNSFKTEMNRIKKAQENGEYENLIGSTPVEEYDIFFSDYVIEM